MLVYCGAWVHNRAADHQLLIHLERHGILYFDTSATTSAYAVNNAASLSKQGPALIRAERPLQDTDGNDRRVLSLPIFFIGMARMAHSGALWPTTTS